MSKKCPNCKENIEYLKVSKQIEGCRLFADAQGAHCIVWKMPEEQKEPEIYTCPVCQAEIEDEILEEWGMK